MASVNLSDGDTIKVNVSSEETLNTNLQDINYIPGYIAAEEERRTNEASRISNESTRIANEDTRIENEIAREEYIADLKQRVENGEFNGDIVDVKVDGASVKENGIAYVDLSGKVDKEEGKGLSANDYTTAEKTKLGDLANVKSIGSGLSLDSDGELKNTQTSANWGNITGTLSEQEDLQNALNGKANSTHTHTTTDITNFPTIPSDLSDLTDETNILAGKQNTLTAGDNITIENNVISSTGGGDTIPVGSEFDYDGTTVPEGFEQVSDPTSYSSNEIVIGTWFDKKLYRKYLNFNLTTSTVYNSIKHNISNIDDIFKIEGRVYDGTEFYIIPASLPTDNVSKYGVAIQSITKSEIHIYTGTENKTRNMNCKMFIYYTKTTD